MRWMRLAPLTLLSVTLGCGGGSIEAGPPERIRAFGAADTPITATGVSADDGGWRIERSEAGAVPLFEVPQTALEGALLTYRARMKASGVTGKAYLEMWVRVPGRGEFFSRGLAQPLEGSSEWASYEIPFFLNEKGVQADLVKLGIAFEGGGGTVWVKDVELLKAPLVG